MSDIMNNEEYIKELRDTIENQGKKIEQLRNWRDRLSKENDILSQKTYEILQHIMFDQENFERIADQRISDASYFVETLRKSENCLDSDKVNFYQVLHDHAQALSMEAIELINWLPWKGWTEKLGNSWDRQEGNEQLSDEHILEIKKESLDCFIFCINLFLILGMDATEVFEMYDEKLKTNESRLKEGY